MESSQAPHESPAKVADNEVEPGSMSRFRALAAKLFDTDPETFRDARAKDEAERRAKRGL